MGQPGESDLPAGHPARAEQRDYDLQRPVLADDAAGANYPDLGDTQGCTGYLTEQDGIIFAFNSGLSVHELQ